MILATLALAGHMMVSGGVHKPADLKSHLNLYPGFNMDKALFTRTIYAQFAHVSYRLNGSTFWTKSERFIPAGEPIVTDGTFVLLQRCGNLVEIAAPFMPLSPDPEPTDVYPMPLPNYPAVAPPTFLVDFPEPMIPETPDVHEATPGLTFTPSSVAPPANTTTGGYSPYSPPIFVPGGPSNPPVTYPASESSTGFMVAVSLAALLILARLGRFWHD